MAQGSKQKYTEKQKRRAEHIEEGYRERGTPRRRAERIAWIWEACQQGARWGRKGGRAAARRPTSQRKASARKAARTRRRRR